MRGACAYVKAHPWKAVSIATATGFPVSRVVLCSLFFVLLSLTPGRDMNSCRRSDLADFHVARYPRKTRVIK